MARAVTSRGLSCAFLSISKGRDKGHKNLSCDVALEMWRVCLRGRFRYTNTGRSLKLQIQACVRNISLSLCARALGARVLLLKLARVD